MFGKTSTVFALYILACVISMTSTVARSRHQRHNLRGEGRPRGRHRHNEDNNNNNNNKRHSDFREINVSSSSSLENHDDDDDDLGYYHPEERKVNGISVPALHSMQTYGLKPSSDRKERRPIRGSRKAVVVTKKTYLKKEWCKTQPLKQVVRMKGCLKTKILNNFCYGQCNSFFIPKKARRDKNAEAFLSCGFCRPRRFRWILVTLRCPGKNGVRFKRKRVQFIKKCRCMAQEVSLS
ncbi:hypothetical protein ACOMHN_066387 [Nucella lapillus]